MIAAGANTANAAKTHSAMSASFTCVVSPKRSLVESDSGLGLPTATRSLAAPKASTAPRLDWLGRDEYGVTAWRRSGLAALVGVAHGLEPSSGLAARKVVT